MFLIICYLRQSMCYAIKRNICVLLIPLQRNLTNAYYNNFGLTINITKFKLT